MKKHILTVSILVNLVFAGLVVRHYVLMPKPNLNPRLTYFVNRDQVLKNLPKDSNDVLFVGDSQFQSYEVSELFGSINVKNRGIYYDTSTGVLHRSLDIASGHPAKVFIEIGVNDLLANESTEKIINNVSNTIKTIQEISPQTEIYLLSVFPTSLIDNTSISRKILNNGYRSLSKKSNVTFIDLDKQFLNKGLNANYDSGDKVHLNAKGYGKLTDVLKAYIK
ncbi:GDSL-type esterase/lipase family protein [Mucilaginibacter sp. 5C4]|uniref:GDSL-type esterase/lipase family protein n=1 Tax=Mucilaginibacter sp. 5C4 TaxID=3048589 RepID=UPI002AC9D7EA|nr:GDSL-type esterase/lipase family protein [Mucilaginibacter sp. 5C4]MEB0302396.1 GDSL-type esterase/lipase family protein [Mucilaginibacter sp. 5C4]WPX22962.1 GDSL-type esterase/lipase family protein [Mucilaginibacter sp. 5C4]